MSPEAPHKVTLVGKGAFRRDLCNAQLLSAEKFRGAFHLMNPQKLTRGAAKEPPKASSQVNWVDAHGAGNRLDTDIAFPVAKVIGSHRQPAGHMPVRRRFFLCAANEFETKCFQLAVARLIQFISGCAHQQARYPYGGGRGQAHRMIW